MTYASYEPERSGERRVDADIRAATASDVQALARIAASRGGSLHSRAAGFADALAEPGVIVLIALVEGTPAGWTGAREIDAEGDPGTWMTTGLTVVPEWRRRGIASQLLEAVAASVSSVGGERLVSVANARNRASLDLHLGSGFTEVARAASFLAIEFDGGEGVIFERALD
mgnify:CR=1 FL=1